MNLQTVIALISAAIGMVLFLGSVAVYLRGSVDKGTITALNANNDALTKRVDILESTDHENQVRIQALERENTYLLSQRPSAELIADVKRRLESHHNEAMEKFTEMTTVLEKLCPPKI